MHITVYKEISPDRGYVFKSSMQRLMARKLQLEQNYRLFEVYVASHGEYILAQKRKKMVLLDAGGRDRYNLIRRSE